MPDSAPAAAGCPAAGGLVGSGASLGGAARHLGLGADGRPPGTRGHPGRSRGRQVYLLRVCPYHCDAVSIIDDRRPNFLGDAGLQFLFISESVARRAYTER
jgi:hypothetical protein